MFGEEGWVFGAGGDPVHPDFKFLHQGTAPTVFLCANALLVVYTLSKKDYTGPVTVPVLFDVTLNTIASNESVCCLMVLRDSNSN